MSTIEQKLFKKANKTFLFVMAAKQEYGENLQKIFDPLFVGVGPIEAAITTSIALTQLKAQNSLPDFVVSIGSAGSKTLEQTAIYQVCSVSWRDIDASPFGIEKGITPFLNLPKEIALPCYLKNTPKARLSTGANVVTGNGYDDIDADMVDMESYAILRCCQQFNVPLIGLRGISDGKDQVNHIDDWQLYLHIIDEKLAQCAVQLLETIN